MSGVAILYILDTHTHTHTLITCMHVDAVMYIFIGIEVGRDY